MCYCSFVSMADIQVAFSPNRQPVALRIGFPEQPKPESDELTYHVSVSAGRCFDKSDYGTLNRLAFNEWDEAVDVMRDDGASEKELLELTNAGMIRRLPGVMTPSAFLKHFDDLAIITLTGGAVRSIDDELVVIATPNDPEGGFPVSPLLWEVILRSHGDRSFTELLTFLFGRDRETAFLIAQEVIVFLGHLVKSEAVAVISASARDRRGFFNRPRKVPRVDRRVVRKAWAQEMETQREDALLLEGARARRKSSRRAGTPPSS